MVRRINEELSVADEVIEATDRILDMISNLYPEARHGRYRKRTMSSGDGVYYVVHEVPVQLSADVFGLTLSLSITIFELQDKSFMGDFSNVFSPEGNYNGHAKLITLTSCCLRGDSPCNQILRNTLQHELEHVFQMVKSGNNVNDKRYRMAVHIINNAQLGDVFMDVADLVYSLSNREIDANINGLYAELTYLLKDRNNKNDTISKIMTDALHSTRYYQLKVDRIEKLNNVINGINSCNRNILKWLLSSMEFKSASHLISYLKGQMKRMFEKEMKVIQNAYNRHKLDEATLFVKWNTDKTMIFS